MAWSGTGKSGVPYKEGLIDIQGGSGDKRGIVSEPVCFRKRGHERLRLRDLGSVRIQLRRLGRLSPGLTWAVAGRTRS